MSTTSFSECFLFFIFVNINFLQIYTNYLIRQNILYITYILTDIYLIKHDIMAETQDITQISVNGTVYSVGGGGGNSPFTLTEKNGAQMSACTSTGQYAVAEGVSTTASGNYGSHAEGAGTTASGDYSHAEGWGTSATTQSEHASGRYNISLSGSSTWGDSGNTLFTVGNGYATADTHNALQIMQDGTIYIADTSGEGEYYQKPMIKLQALINRNGSYIQSIYVLAFVNEKERQNESG